MANRLDMRPTELGHDILEARPSNKPPDDSRKALPLRHTSGRERRFRDSVAITDAKRIKDLNRKHAD